MSEIQVTRPKIHKATNDEIRKTCVFFLDFLDEIKVHMARDKDFFHNNGHARWETNKKITEMAVKAGRMTSLITGRSSKNFFQIMGGRK